MTDNKELALSLATAGFKVIPCFGRSNRKAKAPLVPRGQYDATTDPEIIAKWFQGAADKLIGIPCKASGFFAVDADGPEGAATWDAWIKANGPVSGPCQKTMHGFHYLFKHPSFDFPGSVKKLGAGVDLRSNNYICTGGDNSGYEWIVPLTEPLPEAPAWLLAKIKAITPKLHLPERDTLAATPPEDPGAVVDFWLDRYTAQAFIGNRNEMAFKMGMQLHNSGVTMGAALYAGNTFIHAIPNAGGDEYFSLAEYEAAIKSAYKTIAREPATLPRQASEPAAKVERPKTAAAPEVHIIPHIEVEPEFEADLGRTEATRPENRKHCWSVAELYDTVFPEPRWIIPGLIPVGLTLFAGRPKAGKSLYMMNVAAAVGSGGHFWGQDVTQGEVLYLFLEDSPRILKDRMLKMRIPRGAQITFEREWRPLHDGGLDDLTVQLIGHDYRLIVIDTLATSLPGIDHNKDQVTLDYVLNNLHKMAVDQNMGLVCNDHTRKGNGMFPDPIDDISGNSAKSRNADHILGLYLEPGKQGATLKGKGREVAPLDLNCHFDQDTFCWQLDGAADDVRNDSLKGEILKAIQALTEDGDQPTSTKIAKFLGSERANVAHGLADLLNAGKVRKGDRVGIAQPYYLREVGIK